MMKHNIANLFLLLWKPMFV